MHISGDGLLAIFPNGLPITRRMDGEPPLDIVIALHVGTVHYGNIGSPTAPVHRNLARAT